MTYPALSRWHRGDGRDASSHVQPRLVSFCMLHARPAATAQKGRDRHNGRSPLSFALAFGNNRWRRRGFALAVRRSVLCEGRDAKKRHRRCSQYSECFHQTILLRHVTNDDASLQRWLTHSKAIGAFATKPCAIFQQRGKSHPSQTQQVDRADFGSLVLLNQRIFQRATTRGAQHCLCHDPFTRRSSPCRHCFDRERGLTARKSVMKKKGQKNKKKGGQ